MTGSLVFSARHRTIALAFAEALLPAGKVLPGASAPTVDRLERMLARAGMPALYGYSVLLDWLEISTVLRRGRRFSQLALEDRIRLLEDSIEAGPLRSTRLLLLGLPVKAVHFDDPEIFRRVGCVYDRSGKPETARWQQQVFRAADLPEEEIECDAVVVGTGAGGAVVAKELAEAGLAVVMVEEGEYFNRKDFTGRALESMEKMYRPVAETFSVGNALVWIPLGRTVGGSTTVNSGTCFRTPSWVLERWQRELGLTEFTQEHMERYFSKVEAELGVAEARAEYLGGVARVVARGCDKLGWSHHALKRNAPECDGQGVCVFGCPTDAKRSTNVSYVPMALERAAMLVTGARAERIFFEGSRARGIEARILGAQKRLRIRARAVVLACGTLHTPVFLMRQGLLRENTNLGQNLTIHPAVGAAAMFDEEIRAHMAIPQGYCVDEFHRDGILMEGATPSFDSGASMFNLVGPELTEIMENYDRVAFFGAMICEQRGAGKVRPLRKGGTLIRYTVTEEVREKLHTAMVRIGRIFFAAGAKRFFPAMVGVKEIHSECELERFAAARPPARKFILTAYHPLGTCRIGRNPSLGVVDTSHRVFGIPGLYVCDGSVIPTSPTVNPQITIMALATRAAEHIAADLS